MARSQPRNPQSRNQADAVPAQVTIIGHNSQLLPTVGFFVGGGVPVQVFTCSDEVEVQLAPYPDVQVTKVSADYDVRPDRLPPGPYVLTLDQLELAERIRAWLPATVAVFLQRALTRRQRLPKGFLTLSTAQVDLRPQVWRRLWTLARVDRLMDIARSAQQPPLILMYGDPDPDAIGAALGLAAIWRAAGATPMIRYSGEVQRYQNKLLLSYLKQPIERLREAERADADLIAVVDAQPGFWRESPPPARVIIDHHPRRDDTASEYLDLRDSYGATSTILTEYLVAADFPLGRPLATALIYGLITDTDDLKRHTSSADIRAFDLLHARADAHFLSRLAKSQIPMAMLDAISWGISHRVVYDDLALIHFGRVDSVDTLVQVADLLLFTCGIAWTVCVGVHDDTLVLIFRGDGHRQDVGRRARLAFAKIGSAGGHRTMGRAEIPLGTMTLGDTAELVVNHLFKRMGPARRRKFIARIKANLDAPPPADHDDFDLIPT